MSDAKWAWQEIEDMAERWNNTSAWHDPPFHDGKIHVTTRTLHAAVIVLADRDSERTRAETAERERDEARRDLETTEAGLDLCRRGQAAAETHLREALEFLDDAAVAVGDAAEICRRTGHSKTAQLAAETEARIRAFLSRRTGEPPAEPTAGFFTTVTGPTCKKCGSLLIPQPAGNVAELRCVNGCAPPTAKEPT